jgi:hypothetical protein
MSADVLWGSLLASLTAVEAWAIIRHKEGYTLSERIREWFSTDTRTGKVVFTAALTALYLWFLPHIIFGG